MASMELPSQGGLADGITRRGMSAARGMTSSANRPARTARRTLRLCARSGRDPFRWWAAGRLVSSGGLERSDFVSWPDARQQTGIWDTNCGGLTPAEHQPTISQRDVDGARLGRSTVPPRRDHHLTCIASAYLLRALKIEPLSTGFIAPAQPVKASKPPVGTAWAHETSMTVTG
jgi:hypothetical protein